MRKNVFFYMFLVAILATETNPALAHLGQAVIPDAQRQAYINASPTMYGPLYVSGQSEQWMSTTKAKVDAAIGHIFIDEHHGKRNGKSDAEIAEKVYSESAVVDGTSLPAGTYYNTYVDPSTKEIVQQPSPMSQADMAKYKFRVYKNIVWAKVGCENLIHSFTQVNPPSPAPTPGYTPDTGGQIGGPVATTTAGGNVYVFVDNHADNSADNSNTVTAPAQAPAPACNVATPGLADEEETIIVYDYDDDNYSRPMSTGRWNCSYPEFQNWCGRYQQQYGYAPRISFGQWSASIALNNGNSYSKNQTIRSGNSYSFNNVTTNTNSGGTGTQHHGMPQQHALPRINWQGTGPGPSPTGGGSNPGTGGIGPDPGGRRANPAGGRLAGSGQMVHRYH